MTQTAQKRPAEPDTLADGTPNVTYLRTSRARQVNFNPTYDDRTTEPVTHATHHGIIRRILRGVLAHWLPLGFGLLLMIGLYTGYQQWVAPTWANLQAQWHTDDGRIVQMDADVGHGGVSHFLAQYYNGQVVVIEISLNNPTHIHTYSVQAITPGASKQDLTITVEDVNHDGKPDLVIQEGNNTMALILYNTGTAFTATEGEYESTKADAGDQRRHAGD